MRHPSAEPGDESGTNARQSIARGRKKGRNAVFSRLPGALARAIIIILLIILPSALLPVAHSDGALIVVLVALSAGVFTTAEYCAKSPSLVEFRDAPPFNRIRFIALFMTVFSLCVILGGDGTGSTFQMFFQVIGSKIAALVDFPYSPVRLMLVMMPDSAPDSVMLDLRTSAGLTYVASLLSVAVFYVMLRLNAWPRRTTSFNFWVNLPTFDPTAGGDVVERLNRDSGVNLILGFLLPFMIPAVMKASSVILGPMQIDDPQTMIWTVVLWAFLPSSLLMRGVALGRVAGMIQAQRKKAYAAAAAEGMLPV